MILSGQLHHNASKKVVEDSAVESKVQPKEKQAILPEQRVDDKKDSLDNGFVYTCRQICLPFWKHVKGIFSL